MMNINIVVVGRVRMGFVVRLVLFLIVVLFRISYLGKVLVFLFVRFRFRRRL